MPCAVVSYSENGECALKRGTVPVKVYDQFSLEPEPERRVGTTTSFVRDSEMRDKCLARANGLCEFCGERGFATADGGLYLETHHIVPLSEGGRHTVGNMAALCANHHHEAHHGIRGQEIREILSTKIFRDNPEGSN
jgi:predicted restriction endonuclease